jgi:hypothetical protein
MSMTAPPPGSQPMTVTRPSQLRAAECQLLTPPVVKLVMNLGFGRVADVVHGRHLTGAEH